MADNGDRQIQQLRADVARLGRRVRLLVVLQVATLLAVLASTEVGLELMQLAMVVIPIALLAGGAIYLLVYARHRSTSKTMPCDQSSRQHGANGQEQAGNG